jgi:hypothetical protein
LHQFNRPVIREKIINIYISYEVKIGKYGVVENLTIFSGDQFFEKMKFLMGDDREGIPDCNPPNAKGSKVE